jgi:hypothetical protein
VAYEKGQATKKGKKLVEEIDTLPSASPKGILKKSASTPTPVSVDDTVLPADTKVWATPVWTWSREGDNLQIKIQLPNIVRHQILPTFHLSPLP